MFFVVSAKASATGQKRNSNKLAGESRPLPPGKVFPMPLDTYLRFLHDELDWQNEQMIGRRISMHYDNEIRRAKARKIREAKDSRVKAKRLRRKQAKVTQLLLRIERELTKVFDKDFFYCRFGSPIWSHLSDGQLARDMYLAYCSSCDKRARKYRITESHIFSWLKQKRNK